MSRLNPRFRRNNPSLPSLLINTFRVQIVGTLEAQLTVNDFVVRDAGYPLLSDQSNETNAMTFVWNQIGTLYRACLSNEWTCSYLRAQCLNALSRAPVYDTSKAGNLGTGGVGHLPTTVAAVITKYTAYRGQCGRGRIYLPAVPVGFVTSPNESTVNATALTAYNALATALKGSAVANTQTFTWAHYSLGGARPGPRIAGSADVVNVVVRSLLGTCRRRRIGRGK